MIIPIEYVRLWRNFPDANFESFFFVFDRNGQSQEERSSIVLIIKMKKPNKDIYYSLGKWFHWEMRTTWTQTCWLAMKMDRYNSGMSRIFRCHCSTSWRQAITFKLNKHPSMIPTRKHGHPFERYADSPTGDSLESIMLSRRASMIPTAMILVWPYKSSCYAPILKR